MRMCIKILKFLSGFGIATGLFLLLVGTGIISVPVFTTEHYKAHDSPTINFRVVLETYDEAHEQSQFHCIRWDDFQQMQRNDYNEYVSRTKSPREESTVYFETVYYAALSLSEGSCVNTSSDFKVEYLEDNTQIVRLNLAQEAFKWRNSYRVENHTVIPLYSCTFMSAGICISIFLVSIILLPMIILFFRFCKKNFGRPIATGFAFVLVGVCAFIYAAVNWWMSLDDFFENSQSYIFASKYALGVAVVFFLSFLVCIWLQKKKRIAGGAPA